LRADARTVLYMAVDRRLAALFAIAPIISCITAFAAFSVVPFGTETTLFGLLDQPIPLQVTDVTWPAARPMHLDLALILPGGGKFGAKGPVAIEPLDVTLAVTTYDAPIEPYHAYFPFPDGIAAAASAGVTAIIQPGGSIRDEMAIEVADRHHMAMVFTGKRHFRH